MTAALVPYLSKDKSCLSQFSVDMKMGAIGQYVIRLVVLVIVTTLSYHCGQIASAQDETITRTKPNQYALLVGVTAYPELPENCQLFGPGNDVLLMKQLLVDRFHFPEENVVVLAENAGQPDSLPTRANIEREWKRLVRTAQRDDQIVILMAGHGTQVPELKDDHAEPEQDGLDEVFLPSDVKGWNNDTVENGIRDNDFRRWIKAIEDTGASLWLIFDACHSGTLTRDVRNERIREIRPRSLGVPQAALEKAHTIAAQRNRRSGARPHEKQTQLLDQPAKTRGGPDATQTTSKSVTVALFAAQSIETTPEVVRGHGANRKYYGLLTYTLVDILKQAESGMTYRELVAQVYREYASKGRNSPTPVLEGTDIDRQVLGLASFPERSRIWLVETVDGGWEINAGALSGLTPNSILAVYPVAGQADADKVIGHVRILPDSDSVDPLVARVEPWKYNNMPAPATSRLKSNMRCQPVYRDYGDQRLRVAVDTTSDSNQPLSEQQQDKLRMILGNFVDQDTHLAQLVEPADAHWLLRYGDLQSQQLFLVPASGWSRHDDDTERPPLFGPAPDGDRLTAWLSGSLTSIARAQSLLRIAGTFSKASQDLQMQLIDQGTGKPFDVGRGDLELTDGTEIGFRVKNVGQDPLDVTLLIVDANYGIQCIHPVNKSNRLQSNRLHRNDDYTYKARIGIETTGKEYCVAIAVKSKDNAPESNFAFLQQATLERTRDVSNPGPGSPLGQLLTTSFYGVEKTRSVKAAPPPVSSADIAITTITWKTVASRRSQ